MADDFVPELLAFAAEAPDFVPDAREAVFAFEEELLALGFAFAAEPLDLADDFVPEAREVGFAFAADFVPEAREVGFAFAAVFVPVPLDLAADFVPEPLDFAADFAPDAREVGFAFAAELREVDFPLAFEADFALVAASLVDRAARGEPSPPPALPSRLLERRTRRDRGRLEKTSSLESAIG